MRRWFFETGARGEGRGLGPAGGSRLATFFVAITALTCWTGSGAELSGSFNAIAPGSTVNLTAEGGVDWVHWGLYTESSLNRKASVAPQISDFTVQDSPAGFAFVYWFGDNAHGYTWSDGTPTAAVTNTTTGVWAFGTPPIGSGFEVTVPADSITRTFKIYVGAFGARGQLTAHLSDQSAPAYTDSSLFNQSSGPGGSYSITYAAASADQQLIVRWTLLNPFRQDGNVTLQAATLTAMNFNNPPAVALTSPLNNATSSAGGTVSLEADASDSDGTIAKVEFLANGIPLGEDTIAPYAYAWSGVPAGPHVLTVRATDVEGASSESAPVEVFVSGTGGSLMGSLAVPPVLPLTVNLTAEGLEDWAHWGLATNNLFNHKADVPQRITDFEKIGTSPLEIYDDNYTAFSWTDGTPTSSATGVRMGVFTVGAANGFEFTAPADTTSRTLKIYVGLYGAQGNLQAWLSDYSGVAFTDTSLSNVFGNAYGIYTLTYAAASPGQTLFVRYRSLRVFDRTFGNVTLQAATLVPNTTGDQPPTVGITSPANGTVLTAPASFTLGATATDPDGAVISVEFFNGATSLGTDVTDPYSIDVNDLAAGLYTLSAVATDDSGARGTNSITISVSGSPAEPVTLLNPAWDGMALMFSFASQAGRTYEAQSIDVLGTGAWKWLTNVTGNGGVMTLTNQNPGAAQRFYRIESK